jgi:hypothetical protein
VVNSEETREQKRQREELASRMDIEDHDIIIQGAHTTRLSRKQVRTSVLFLLLPEGFLRLKAAFTLVLTNASNQFYETTQPLRGKRKSPRYNHIFNDLSHVLKYSMNIRGLSDKF